MRNNEDRLGTNQIRQDALPLPDPTQKQNGSGLSFIAPTEFVSLPSKGKFYPEGHPLKDKETIEIKQMTAKEEDILTSKSLLKKGVAIDKLIESLIVDKSIDPETLTIEDRSSIVISARISGYGPEYVTSVTCPSCSNKSKFSFNLLNKVDKEDNDEIESLMAENLVDFEGGGFFSFKLPVTGWKVMCRALTGDDERIILKLNETKKKSNNDSILIDQLKMMIVSIQDVTDIATIDSAIAAMPAGDSRYLRKMYSRVVTPVDLTQPYFCSKCEYEADMEVPLTADFFWFK